MKVNIEIVITSAPDNKAKTLANGLLNHNLAACINLFQNTTSYFKWKGKIREENETIILCKTITPKISGIYKWILKNHPYNTPEIISFTINNASNKYYKWIIEEIKF